MNQKLTENHPPRDELTDAQRRTISLGFVTFVLVFTAGFLITNWLSFIPN